MNPQPFNWGLVRAWVQTIILTWLAAQIIVIVIIDPLLGTGDSFLTAGLIPGLVGIAQCRFLRRRGVLVSRWWPWLSGVGFALAIGFAGVLFAVLEEVAGLPMPTIDQRPSLIAPSISWVPLGVVAGLAVGAGQALLLRGTTVDPYLWILATLLGYSAGMIIGWPDAASAFATGLVLTATLDQTPKRSR